ncbi:MAG: TonB-dependent receptor [Proteobacteria bacterium]|nr:TonB-dependent receptor [Pseudomonadota bacterium]
MQLERTTAGHCLGFGTVAGAWIMAGLLSPAYAQTPRVAASDIPMTEVVVTGSMLRRTDTETESPVTTLTSEDIQKSGLTTIADVVRTVSADNSGTIPTAFGAGFAAGASGVALRGLTVNSTLVLIDGRRAAPYAVADDGQRSFVDLNTIPLDSVERVEVLKDGASSIYGADAIAGVVNVILKKEYRGAELYAEAGKGQHPGGGTERFTASLGTGELTTDRFNAYVNFEFQGDSRVLTRDRPFPFNTFDLSPIGGTNSLAGFPGSFTGTPTAIVAPATLAPDAPAPGYLNTTLAGAYRLLGSGRCAGLASTAASAPSQIDTLTDNYCLQNRAAYIDDQPAQQRVGVSARFTVQLGNDINAYTNASYYQNTVIIDAPPSSIQAPVSVNTNNIALPPTLPGGGLNPNNPFAAAGQYALIQYAFGDIPALNILENHNLRWVTGLKGSKWGWDFDTGLVINHTWLDTDTRGLLNGPALLAAVTNGTYNFVDPSANTAAERAALSPDLIKTSTTDLDSFDLKLSRELWNLPGGPLGLGLGAEVRYEAQADPALNPNNEVQGLGIAQTAGSRRVEAAYFEVGAPLIKMLNVDVSGRYDHYSDFGNAFTPKVGFKLNPIRQIALRGTYSRGFRAPAFAENGSSSSEGFITKQLPAFFCALHSAAYCLPYPLALLSSANPNIQPEKSDSYTFGVVLEPSTHFSASIDAYAIKKSNVITAPDARVALTPYLLGQPLPPGSSVIPDLPDPANPTALARPAVLVGLYANANSLRTDGLDLDLRGNFTFGDYGKWTSDLSLTKIFSFKLVFPDGTSDQYVGTQAPYALSSGAGTPRYRGAWVNSYAMGPVSLTLTTYYTSGFRETAIDATGDPQACLYSDTFCHVASFIDMDLTGIYKFNDHLSTSFTVANLLDRLPPIDPADYAGQNYNPTYAQAGIIGRFFKIGVSYKL